MFNKYYSKIILIDIIYIDIIRGDIKFCMEKSKIQKSTLGRLPLYVEYINGLPEGVKNISSAELAKYYSLGEVQVRKDLASVCCKGKPKIGFDRKELVKCLKDLLSSDNYTVLIGAGKIGKAILDYNGFDKFGIKIYAAFDSDKEKTGKSENGKPIFHISELKKYCIDNKVKIGILTVPVTVAQSVCDDLIEAGVHTIWNFAPLRLKTPEHVNVRNEDLALSLAYLNLQIN